MCGLGAFYFFFYRKFLHPKSVNNSLVYNQAITYIKQSQVVKNQLGNKIQYMCAQGKIHPWKNDVNFNIVAYGSD
jgi:hypothetical protein